MVMIKCLSFGKLACGRVITSDAVNSVVQTRNPYGGHNLVVVDNESGEAIRHGNNAALNAAYAWMPERAFRKVCKYLAKQHAK